MSSTRILVAAIVTAALDVAEEVVDRPAQRPGRVAAFERIVPERPTSLAPGYLGRRSAIGPAVDDDDPWRWRQGFFPARFWWGFRRSIVGRLSKEPSRPGQDDEAGHPRQEEVRPD